MSINREKLNIETSIRDSLKNIGFTDYYVNLYIGLLGQGDKNARELSDYTGVPYSRIYKILNEMSEKGIITKIDGRPSRFIANEPISVFKTIKKQQDELFEVNINQSLSFLKSLYGDKRIKKLEFNLYEGKACVEHLRSLIKITTRTLFMVIKNYKDVFPIINENLEGLFVKNVDFKLILELKHKNHSELSIFNKDEYKRLFHLRYIPFIQEGFVISDNNEGVHGLKGHFDIANPQANIYSIFSSDENSYITYLSEMFSQLWDIAKE